MDPTHPGSPFQVLPSVNSLDPHRQVGTITTLLLQRWELKHRGEQTTAQGHTAELGHEGGGWGGGGCQEHRLQVRLLSGFKSWLSYLLAVRSLSSTSVSSSVKWDGRMDLTAWSKG